MDWEFNYQKGINEFYCTYTKCGLCTLAKREHTLARVDACCDFRVVRKGYLYFFSRFDKIYSV